MRSLSRLAVVLCLFLSSVAFCQQPVPSLAVPSLSPDGAEIAFASGGDIWTVPVVGGDAHLLIAHPATETRPLYSPDGKYLAFVSTRSGNGNIYLLELATGALRRLTFDDGSDQLDAWSPDGKYLYFSSTAHDISGMNDIYRISVDGGTPMAVSFERYVNEYNASPSPDGATLALVARGVASAQWWRNGHSHLDETEIWTLRDGKYDRLITHGAKQLWPMWSPDGHTLYYMSDRSGTENIWALADGQQRQITHFTTGRVLWPSISRDGRRIVFERDFGIWLLNVTDGSAVEVPIRRVGSPSGAGVEHKKLTDNIRELSLSPDGKKVAFVVRGEIFAASAKDGGDAVRVTNTQANEADIAWSPDNRRIVYSSDRDGREHLFLYDFAEDRETQLTRGDSDEFAPLFSPDGTMLAFQRDRRQIIVYDLTTKKETVIASGMLDRPPMGSEQPFDWSPDSRWIVYTSHGDKLFRNAFVVPVKGGTARPVTYLSNVFSNSVSWSPDGKFLLMTSGQRTEDTQVARIDLVPRTPRFSEDQFRDLFKDEKEKDTAQPPAVPDKKTDTKYDAPDNKKSDAAFSPQKKDAADAKPENGAKPEDKKGKKARPTEVVFEGVRQRISILPLGLDVRSQHISPDGKWLALVANAAGQENIYIYPLDELSKEQPVAKQLTATRGRKGAVQFTPDSKELFYLEDGKINMVALETSKPRPLPVVAEMDVDFATEKREAFAQAWTLLRDTFFDEKMNGVDWTKLREVYAPRVAAAANPDEMRRIISLMIGELNASHSGISAPMEDRRTSTGRLAVRFDTAEYEKTGKLRVAEVVPLGPAALAGIKQGDYLVAVEGAKLGPHTNLDSLLDYRLNRKTTLTISADATQSTLRSISLKPINTATEKNLLYKAWVQKNREYVERVSGGRIGYVHMFDMGESSLRQFFLDLDSETHMRQGVIIDVRNNNGGFVNAYALDVLARRPYLNMTYRGFSPAPARTILGQRALELPTILVTNQHSLSDAEDFTEGYRALGLGKVVGEPTAGWIIYTSGATLIDGSQLRLPFSRITTEDGADMEMHPRPVDVEVQRPLGETAKSMDCQLDSAVSELSTQLAAQPKKRQPTAAGK